MIVLYSIIMVSNNMCVYIDFSLSHCRSGEAARKQLTHSRTSSGRCTPLAPNPKLYKREYVCIYIYIYMHAYYIYIYIYICKDGWCPY